MGDGSGFAGGAGDGGGAGVGLEAFGILEPGSVVADLGEHPGAGQCAEPWEAGDDPGVRVQVKRLGDGVLEVGGGGAGGVELAEQGQGLPAHGVLDERELAHLAGAERLAQPGGFGVHAAAAAGFFQQAAQLGHGQLGGVGGGGGGGQDGAGLGPGDAAAGRGEGGQEGGEYSRRWERSLLCAVVRSQTASCWARASTAMAWASSVSAGSGRCACRSVRSTPARTTESPWSDLRPATECRSR